MVTGELKRRIDALWTEFWQGGITNPLTVIEQITFLMYARLLDINETRDENRQKRRDEVLGASAADFKRFGEVLAEVAKAGQVVVLGSEGAVNAANAERGGSFFEVTPVL